MRETVYNRILSRVIRSPIFHQVSYSLFFSLSVASFETDANAAPSSSYRTQNVQGYFPPLHLSIIYSGNNSGRYNPITNSVLIKCNTVHVWETCFAIIMVGNCCGFRTLTKPPTVIISKYILKRKYRPRNMSR